MKNILVNGLLFLIISLCFSSCSSGTWEDDKDNWERAFKAKPSKEIKIIHSWYWRSPHFTYEGEYFFEIEYSERIAEEFHNASDLVKVDPTEYQSIHFFNDKPKWFVPNDFSYYEIWKSKLYPTYYLFTDKKNKKFFFTEYQT